MHNSNFQIRVNEKINCTSLYISGKRIKSKCDRIEQLREWKMSVIEQSGQKMKAAKFLAKDEKSDGIEVKTDGSRLIIALFIFV